MFRRFTDEERQRCIALQRTHPDWSLTRCVVVAAPWARAMLMPDWSPSSTDQIVYEGPLEGLLGGL